VSLPPREMDAGEYGEEAGARAARVWYLAEADLVAARRGDGWVAADKVPDLPLLPSGRPLAP
jgi:hypothetical protein